MGIKSGWVDFDEEVDLYLKLAATFMDKWTISSAELVHAVLLNGTHTQKEIGRLLGIKQSGVSGRWNRANVEEMLAMEKRYRKKMKTLLS